MKQSSLKLITSLIAGVIGITSVQLAVNAQLAVQRPTDVVGTGPDAWSYLILEAENYTSKVADDSVGFTKVGADAARTDFYGNPVLGANTTASGKGALFGQTTFSQWADKATYQVQFATPGTYYLYMRFTMFENGGNVAHYLNEDSFFLPPDFGKDPQNDWPLTGPTSGQTGGYVEGCCATAGFLYFPSVGDPTRVPNTADTNHWEGNFHWNDLISSQFLNPATTGEPSVRFKYEVTPDKVGRPLDFTIGYREGGVTVDLFLFSTHTNLMNVYTEANLDTLLIKDNKLAEQSADDKVGTGANAWSYLVLEGENYVSKVADEAVGFTKVYGDGARTDFHGNPVLGPDTTASGKGALFGQTIFSQWLDKATYQVQFATPGTYYLYMRFTMFENGGNAAHYLNEDSFFLPPDFDKDPQNDWPLTGPTSGQTGGYVEGCCASAGFLYFPSVGDPTRVPNTSDTNHWEGNFHWNDLISSQFLNPATTGEPNVRFKYEVTPDKVGKPLNFTIGYREGGVTIDLFLFSTHTNLMDAYTEANLDDLFINKYKLTVQDPAKVVGTGANAWSYVVLEGEDFGAKVADSAVGFTKVYDDEARTDFYGNPVLGANTTASGKGALFGQTIFSQWLDKVTYQVQFATPGTYYLYMRFTMFENGGNVAHYLNEDSFFLPPDFGKDPQNDWPLTGPTSGQTGGYVEGCCATAGFLYFPTVGDPTRIPNTADTNSFEGTFHWNDLISSQFLNPATTGEPGVRFKYEVTPDKVGRPLDFTIGYREGGVTVDLFLFSTHTNLMNVYTPEELDNIIVNPTTVVPKPALVITRSGANVQIAWPTSADGFALESSAILTPPAWTPVAQIPVVAGDQRSVTLDATTGERYYRLKHP